MDPNLSSSVFGNSLILQNIFKHLALPKLKRVRLVSKFWAEESHLHLEKMSCIRFWDHGLEELQNYLQAIANGEMFVHSNYTVTHEYISSQILYNDTMLKFFANVEETQPGRVKYLRIFLSHSSQEYLISLLHSMPKLEELVLVSGGLNIVDNLDGKMYKIPGNVKILQNLKSFVFHNWSNTNSYLVFSLLTQFFIDEPKNLEKVVISDSRNGGVQALDKILELETKGIRSIQVDRIDGDMLKKLIKLDAPLLNVMKIGNIRMTTVSVLQNILAKFASTLKTVEVQLGVYDVAVTEEIPVFEFPAMPQLRNLKFVFQHAVDTTASRLTWGELDDAHDECDACIYSVFQSREANKFPKLTYFELKYTGATPQRYSDLVWNARD